MAPSSSPSSSTPSVSKLHVGDSTIPSSPSIDTSTRAPDDTQTQTFEEIVSYDFLYRLIIILDGTTAFVPSNESTKVVVDCVKGFYRDAWSNGWIYHIFAEIRHRINLEQGVHRFPNIISK
ncbi:uncharacterized protein [Nicotiana sylvestris]|uniref:uncharacterized protein n=1 Tax=Nicotiana sylvestris TaxID=4096 RepID=UPI00388CD183